MKALKNPFKTIQDTLAEFTTTISVLTYKKKKHSIISLQWYFLFHQIPTLDIALIMKLTNYSYSQLSIRTYFYINSSIWNHLLLSTYFLLSTSRPINSNGHFTQTSWKIGWWSLQTYLSIEKLLALNRLTLIFLFDMLLYNTKHSLLGLLLKKSTWGCAHPQLVEQQNHQDY